MKTLTEAANELGFNILELFDYLIESHINGQFKQCKEMFTDLDKDGQMRFLEHLETQFDTDGGIYPFYKNLFPVVISPLRGFKVEGLQATDTKPARIKITDLRYNTSVIVSYGASTTSREKERAIEFLQDLGIEVKAHAWCEKNGQHQYTVLLSDNFNTQIK